VANYINSGTVSVLKNNGDGTYASAVHHAVGSYPSSVLAADLDGDGDQDLAVGNSGGNVSVLKNNGDGTFAGAVTTGLALILGRFLRPIWTGMGIRILRWPITPAAITSRF